jgi:hypothetical protein
MLPTLRPGDVLLTRPRRRGEDLVGRIVVVRFPGRPLSVKRVTARDPDGWWVERDNPAEGIDSWLLGAVPDADVLAVVPVRLAPRLARLPRVVPDVPAGPGQSTAVPPEDRPEPG